DPLTYTATGLPAGLTLDPVTANITGTIAFTEAGTHTVTITVSDGPTTTASTFTWTVQSVDRVPVVTPLANESSPVGAVISLQVVAVGPDDNTLTYSSTGLPTGLTVDAPSGLVTGTLTTPGTYGVTFRASDGTLTGTTSFT